MRLEGIDRQGRRRGRPGARRCLLIVALAAAIPAAAQTAAGRSAGVTAPGTVITNTADLGWVMAGTPRAARSNPDRLIVAERLDVRLAAAAGSADGAAAVDLVNAGNGVEAFAVAAAPAGDAARALTVVVDVDRDGRCDLGIDRVLVDGRTAPLAAGAAIRLLACGTDGATRIVARAATGSGMPGTVFAGQGDGGGDAVVGATGAAAVLVTGDGSPPAGDAPVLTKTQLPLAPDGSARAAAGGTIAYTLAARFPVAVAAAEIEDAVPAGTRLVPGSLRLDGAALSEAEDDDAGALASGVVRVRLGDVPAGAARTITFTVTINP